MLNYFKDTLANVGLLKPDWDETQIMLLKSEINALNVSRIELKNLCQIPSKTVRQIKLVKLSQT